MDALGDLLARQQGVVNRRQALEAGLGPSDLRRLLRRHELVRIHTGVYLDHTGPPSWLQRAWAAVLALEPAALCGPSALRVVRGPGLRSHNDHGPIHVAVDGPRAPATPTRVVVHRIRKFGDQLAPDTSPPRQRLEDAVLDIAATGADDHRAIVTLADALTSRLVTPAQLREALAGRSRLNRRRMLRAVLDDVAAGSCSALEQAYILRVEEAHGLDTARQRIGPSRRGPGHRRLEYAGGLVVELDSRLADRPEVADADDDATAVHLGWGQVVGRPCDTAIRIDRLLRALGGGGAATPCPECRWRGIWAA